MHVTYESAFDVDHADNTAYLTSGAQFKSFIARAVPTASNHGFQTATAAPNRRLAYPIR